MANKHANEKEIETVAPKRRKINRVSTTQVRESSTSGAPPPQNLEPCGIIERIILKNIFCHEYLDFDQFTPHINLLQGANGSGKSSIVAAIIVGLGGSSRNTDRATNLKSIIMNGKNSASIEIHLKNKGHLAYKPQEYGDKVIVERKLTLSGSGTYKIKGGNGQLVSTKKEDLNRILDWYNFQVDNPILVLSQERAKTFLSSTDPKNMFDFFMTATQLKQWSEAFVTIQKDVQVASILVNQKEENLIILEKEVKEWEKKAQAMKSLEKKRDMLSQLRKEKAWAEVEEDELKLGEVKVKRQRYEENLKKVDKVIKETETKIKEYRKSLSESDKLSVELAERTRGCEQEDAAASALFAEAKKQHREKVNHRKNLEKQVFEKERDVAILREKLDKDNTAATRIWENTIAELNEEKRKLQDTIDQLEQQLKTEQTHEQNINRSLQEKDEDYQHHLLEEKAMKDRLASLQSHLRNLRGEKDNLTVFGRFMPRLIRDIDVAHSRGAFRDKPIGPLGSFLKVKNQDWIHIVESVTKNLLSSFLVSCSKDQKTLYSLFCRSITHETRPQIIISGFRNKLHDVRRFETGTDQFFSLWSTIETDNIHVGNTLLDLLSLESILLVPTAAEANDLLIEEKFVPRNCKKAMTLRGDTYFPDPNFKVYSGRGDKRVQFLQVSVEDKVRDLELNINSTKAEVQECQRETAEKRKATSFLAQEKKKSVEKQTRLNRELNICKRQLQELKNREIPPPPDVYQLQKDLEESETLKEEIISQMKGLEEEIDAGESVVKEAEKRLTKTREENKKIKSIITKHEAGFAVMQEEMLRKQKELAAYGARKTEFMKKLDENTEALKSIQDCIEKKTSNVLQVFGNRIKPKGTQKEIERKLLAMQNAIQREESNYGDLDVITTTCQLKMQKYKEIESSLKSQKSFIAKMSESLSKRRMLLKTTRRLLSVFLKSSFNTKISLRKLKGEMDINFETQTLKILMGKDTGEANQQLQSLQMMSGGERSFATVSFILSLWDVVRSPISVMDEFDIFMDVVSRNQCVEMIIESAKQHVQYIMVSPLEYRHKSDKLQVFRMPKPQRSKDSEDV